MRTVYTGGVDLTPMSWMVKNYEVDRELGKGGMGTVYHAYDHGVHGDVALKCLRREMANDPEVLERFRNEAQTQGRLLHANIAVAWEFFQFGAEYYLAMEFVDGPTLAKVLRENRLPLETACRYAIQTLRGLDHAHQKGVVHRDIKPANLMLNSADEIKITDFGIAKRRGASRETKAGMVIGTYEYISPEAAQGLEPTGSSDIYSMGIVLFEMLTGRLPFKSQSELELLRMHVNAPRPAVRSFERDLPEPIDRIVRRAMDRKPTSRFRSAGEMADELNKILESRQNPAPRSWIDILVPRRNTPQPVVNPSGRRTAISSISHHVTDFINQQRFDDADRELAEGFRRFPDDGGLKDIRGWFESQRQQYQLAVAQEEKHIRDLLNLTLPEEALKSADHAISLYPRETSLRELQRDCRRQVDSAAKAANSLAEVRCKVEQLISGQQFRPAADYVLEVPKTRENEPELNRIVAHILQAEKQYKKQLAIDEIVRDANAQAEKNQWESALEIIGRGLQRFPCDQTLQNLSNKVHESRKRAVRQKAVKLVIAEARELEISTSLQAARERLTKDSDELGQDSELRRELERIDSAIAAVRREGNIRMAIEDAAQLRTARRFKDAIALLETTIMAEGADRRLDESMAFLNAELQAEEAKVVRTAEEARRLIEDRHWKKAVVKLSSALLDLPGQPVLNELIEQAQQGLALEHRRRAIAQIKSKAEQRKLRLDYEGAIRSLLNAVAQYPEDAALREALSQMMFERDRHVLQQKVKTAIEQASADRADGNFDKAIQALKTALLEAPSNRDLQSAVEEAEQEWRSIRYQKAVTEISALVGECLRNKEYGPALDHLVPALRDWPQDPVFLDLERCTRTSQREAEQNAALQEALARGDALEAEGRWAEAMRAYEKAIADFPELTAQLATRLSTARGCYSAAISKAKIESFAHRISAYLKADQLDRAEREIELGQSELPQNDFTNWRRLLADKRCEHRQFLLEDLRTRIDASLQNIDLDRAEQQLENTRAIFSSEPIWQSLKLRYEEARERERLVVRPVEFQAAAAKEAASASFNLTSSSSEPALCETRLSDEPPRKWQPELPDSVASGLGNIVRVRSEATSLLEQRRYGEALALLERLLKLYPDDREILNDYEVALGRREANENMKNQHYGVALDLLTALVKKDPNSRSLARECDKASEALERRRKESEQRAGRVLLPTRLPAARESAEDRARRVLEKYRSVTERPDQPQREIGGKDQ